VGYYKTNLPIQLWLAKGSCFCRGEWELHQISDRGTEMFVSRVHSQCALQQSCFVYIVHTSQTSGLFACMKVSRSLICVHVCVCMWLRTGLVFQARFLSLFLSESQVWRLKFWTVLGELCSCSGMGWFVHYSGSKEDTQISATMHWTSMFWKDVGTRQHCYGREMMLVLRNASPTMICSNKLVRCVKTSMLQ